MNTYEVRLLNRMNVLYRKYEVQADDQQEALDRLSTVLDLAVVPNIEISLVED